MSGLLLTLAVGLGTMAAIVVALFLFGCVMCALDDNMGRDRPPLWARAIGGVVLTVIVALFLGVMVRASL